MKEFKVGDEVYIPTSNLGANNKLGRILSIWDGIIAVDFDGHLGHYTISKHTIIRR